MFEKILVANDGSEGAYKALRAAIDIAKQYSAELHQISVEEDLPKYVGTIDEFQEVKEERNHFFERLIRESIAEASSAGVNLIPHIKAGHEVETIINFCKEGSFDLLVIGFMGHSRIFERVWGNTSQTLARLAPCSVLIVK